MAIDEAYEKIFKHVIEVVKVSEEEYRLVSDIVKDIREKVKAKLVGIISEPDDVFVAGSFPRRTFLSRDYDVDIFIRYPTKFSKEELKKITFELAEDILGRENIRARYAEHPYVEASIKGITVNLVPSYKTEPYMWMSAVDRTYYHLKYLNRKLTEEMVNEVLLLKSFLKGIGCYGAEVSIKGVSGYLAELLILHYGTFLNLVKN
ncbi:MAG: nucleotidyltransferase domain-containing protein, partial [Candidatus Geothermarchaeota archaeon]